MHQVSSGLGIFGGQGLLLIKTQVSRRNLQSTNRATYAPQASSSAQSLTAVATMRSKQHPALHFTFDRQHHSPALYNPSLVSNSHRQVDTLTAAEKRSSIDGLDVPTAPLAHGRRPGLYEILDLNKNPALHRNTIPTLHQSSSQAVHNQAYTPANNIHLFSQKCISRCPLLTRTAWCPSSDTTINTLMDAVSIRRMLSIFGRQSSNMAIIEMRYQTL
ncbi:hypothetical protein Vi05172_g2205 [Venturia inaequalis]|nr:hypothetical protein Vi05172_g2205 [Venturia inaequalis]